MMGRLARLGMLGMAVMAGPAARAQDGAWQQPEHLRGFVARGFATDGTPPAASKGPKPKFAPVDAAPPPPVIQPAVQPVAHLSPVMRLSNLSWPRMPHGFQDPTHPVGPAEPGSAAPRYGPVSSGLTLPRR